MRIVGRIYDAFLDGLGYLAGTLIVAAALGITVDVVGRNSPGLSPIPWMLEVVEYCLFLATFAGAPWVLRRGAHVAVDVVVRLLPPRAQAIADAMANLMGLAVSGVLLYYAWYVTMSSKGDGARVIKELIFPEWWLFAFVSGAILLILIEFVVRLAFSLSGRERGGADEMRY